MKKYPHLVKRSWKTKKGIKSSYYYEYPRDDAGKRQLEPLGTDFKAALMRWAEIKGMTLEPSIYTVARLYKDYMAWAEVLENSDLSPRTIKDRKGYWNRLSKVFAKADANKMTSDWLFKYFDARSSKAGAKKEIKFISVMYAWGRLRGKITVPNPADGIMKHLKTNEGREIYVKDEWFALVYECGDHVVRSMMDLCYLCANRPGESITVKWPDVKDGMIKTALHKTAKSGQRYKLTPIEGDLKEFIDKQRARKVTSIYLLSDEDGQPLKLKGRLRNRYRKAMDAAEKLAQEKGIEFTRFTLQDIRAKAATDICEEHGIEAARKSLGHTTQKQTADYIRPLIGELAESSKKDKLAKVLLKIGESG